MGTLARAVERAFKLQTWLPTEAALRLVAGSTRLPSPPSVYFRVVEELDSPNCSVSRAGALIAQDAAMTVKLLQVVNSAVFGLGMQVTTPEEAVLYLGVEATKSLILLAHSFSYFDRAGRLPLSLEALWRHALVTGQCARVIAQAEGLAAEETGLTFTAGLLHDLGKLVLAANRPQDLAAAHAQAQAHAGTLWEAERDLLGATHADVAGCLLALWGLPTAIVEAVALHHTPVALFSSAFNPLTAVHVANVLAHDLAPGEQGPALSVIDQAYVAHLGLADRLDPWRARCQESGLASQPNLP
jgi:HD-like signal output (HDOD) protein